MSEQNEMIARWAQTKGYTFSPEADSFDTENVRELDTFRNWDSAERHLGGEYNGRPFEMLDITKYYARTRGQSYVDQTVLLLPFAAAELPDFEIIPRNTSVGLEFFGGGGLKLAKDDAHRMTREMVEQFSEQYTIYAGGMRETAADTLGKPDAKELDLDAMATICKPGVLKFLTRNPDRYVESQDGHLVIWRSGHVFTENERTAELGMANELLDLLVAAKHEQSVPGMELASTFDLTPGKLGRILGGGAAGFFLGSIFAMILAFSTNPKLILTLPIFGFGGLVAGALLGKKLS